VKAAELLGFGFALVVGWTEPEGRRPYLGALLLAYYDPGGRLIYAGRAGSQYLKTKIIAAALSSLLVRHQNGLHPGQGL
jgi:ATP-dependent DNA ligase